MPVRTFTGFRDLGSPTGAGVDNGSRCQVMVSGGSSYALAAVAAQPDRITRVDIVSGATPAEVSEDTRIVQKLLTGLAGVARTTPSVLRGLFRGQAWLAQRLDPSFVVAQYTAEGNAETVPNAAAETVKEDFVEAFAQYRTAAVTEFCDTATDWGIEFSEIDVEVGMWHGENDTNAPITGVRRLQRKISIGELHVVDDADHLQTLHRSTPDVRDEY